MQFFNWKKIRGLLNEIHLWIGLISGIVLFFVCLSGTIYVYNTEIQEASSPELYKVDANGKQRIPLDVFLPTAQKNIKGTITGVNISADAEKPYVLMVQKTNKEQKGSQSPSSENKEQGRSAANSNPPSEKQERFTSHKGGDISPEGRNNSNKEGQSKREKGKEHPGGKRGDRPERILFNPYTGVKLGSGTEAKTKTSVFMQKMFGLHRWLLLNEIEKPIFKDIENRKLGSWITGTCTILFTLGVITGMAIWFPRRIRSWKNGLKIKWSAGWKRINHDLHNTLGFYSCLFLFLMGITGPFWSFDWYRKGWQNLWGTEISKESGNSLESTFTPGKESITLETAIQLTNKEFPYSGDISITIPRDSSGIYTISKAHTGFFASAGMDRLSIDQYSGEILKKEIFAEKPLAARIGGSIKSLHIGNVYGSFTKLLWFISCLIATTLPITGVLIWINKMKKGKKKKTKSNTTSPSAKSIMVN